MVRPASLWRSLGRSIGALVGFAPLALRSDADCVRDECLQELLERASSLGRTGDAVVCVGGRRARDRSCAALLSFALMQMGRLDEAKAAIGQALAGSRACGDAWSMAGCLITQAGIALYRGDVRAARDPYAQALAALKALGDESGTANVLRNLAELEFADGHPELALQAASESLQINVHGKNAVSIATSHNNCAAYRIALGDLSAARDSARQGLRVARQARDEQTIPIALQHFALLAALGGDARRGAQLSATWTRNTPRWACKREPTEQWGYDKLMAALRETLSEDTFAQLATEDAAWSEDQAVEEA